MGESVETKEKTKDEVDATKADASEEAGNGQKYKKMWKTAGQAAMFTARVASFNWKSVRSVPLKRRVQTFWVLTWLSGIAVLPMLTMILTVFLVVATPFSPFAIGYLTWIFFVDKSATTGSRPRPLSWIKPWRHVRDYFPISLTKTADLEPKRSYVFGYHPHGVISMGALVNFATYATGFDKLFPGINVHVLTLASNFKIPFQREWILWMGLCDASRETCHNILQKGKGESILLAVGGAEESLDAFPGTYKLTLRNRKGFVRVALKAGASLVPVMSFGENELWTALPNPDGSKIRKFQETMKRMLRFTFPVIHGRGIFNYHYGMMPFRRPIHTVVGEPILVDRAYDVEKEEGRNKVNEVHALYISKLKELFESHKTKYIKNAEEVSLVIK